MRFYILIRKGRPANKAELTDWFHRVHNLGMAVSTARMSLRMFDFLDCVKWYLEQREAYKKGEIKKIDRKKLYEMFRMYLDL